MARHEGHPGFSEHFICCFIVSQTIANVFTSNKFLISKIILADASIVRFADGEKVGPESANGEFGEVSEEEAGHVTYNHEADVAVELYQDPGELKTKDWNGFWLDGHDSE